MCTHTDGTKVRFKVLGEKDRGQILVIEDIEQQMDFTITVSELINEPNMVYGFCSKDAYSIGFLAGYHCAQRGLSH